MDPPAAVEPVVAAASVTGDDHVAPDEPAPTQAEVLDDAGDLDGLAAAFPGLADRSAAPVAPPTPSEAPAVLDEELARQLARLSPRAAEAVRTAAEAGSDEEQQAGPAGTAEVDDEPLDRGLLLRFLSSVKT